MAKKAEATNSTGDLASVSTIPPAQQSNADAFEALLESLPIRPDVARIALGRTLAMWVDEGVGASAAQLYDDLLARLVESLPPAKDRLDEFG